nr:hypothetical protein [Rhizobium sp. BG4]
MKLHLWQAMSFRRELEEFEPGRDLVERLIGIQRNFETAPIVVASVDTVAFKCPGDCNGRRIDADVPDAVDDAVDPKNLSDGAGRAAHSDRMVSVVREPPHAVAPVSCPIFHIPVLKQKENKGKIFPAAIASDWKIELGNCAPQPESSMATHGETPMQFPSPANESPTQRFEQAKSIARDAFDELIASANQACWSTEEITVALVEAAHFLRDANHADPDPADDHPMLLTNSG